MDSQTAAERANQLMVDFMIAEGAVWSPALIAAFRATPRHYFLDRVYQYQTKQARWREVITREPGPDELRLLYSDRALITHLSPEGRGEKPVPISSSSQPTLMAQMLEDLQLSPGQKVLEIGAGTGYNAALMAHVVGPERVTSIDVDRNVLSEAWDHLRHFPDRQVQLRHADGRHGFAETAPYDRIMATAATPRLERDWLEQLCQGGMVSAPLTIAPGLAFVICGSVADAVFTGRLMRAAYFMPLRAEGEAGASDEEGELASQMESVPAPWADWLQRRRGRGSWLRLAQSLGFYALLRGLRTSYRSGPEDQPLYGISDGAHTCWLGPSQWYVTDLAARQLGDALWRAWLDTGGAWPTEFEVRIPLDPACRLSAADDEYVRESESGREVWRLIERRERGTWI
jgi:protein-L-isoaspartate(D-aspartate) O-methyltransferase